MNKYNVHKRSDEQQCFIVEAKSCEEVCDMMPKLYDHINFESYTFQGGSAEYEFTYDGEQETHTILIIPVDEYT